MANPNGDPDDAPGRRDVEIPLAVYKRVVVFSTLIAIASVVAGFLLLDHATRRARAPIEAVDPVTAAIGLGLIAFGGVVYAFSTRFKAPGFEDIDRGGETESGKANTTDEQQPRDE